jgi:hypothetical protein
MCGGIAALVVVIAASCVLACVLWLTRPSLICIYNKLLLFVYSNQSSIVSDPMAQFFAAAKFLGHNDSG